VGVQEVRWDRSVTEPAGEYTFSYGKENENHELGTGLFVHKRIISAVKTGLIWLRIRTSGGLLCIPCSIKRGKFLDKLSAYQLTKKESTPWRYFSTNYYW
jgi:hypothetical protein